MIHELQFPDALAGHQLRRIIWDDKAGTVEGNHSAVPTFRRIFDEATLDFGSEWGVYRLNDPAHHAPDFLAVARRLCVYGQRHLADYLPDDLAAIEPTPVPPAPDDESGEVVY